MSAGIEQAVRSLRRRILFGGWFGHSVRLATWLVVLCAALALFARVVLHWPLDRALWLMLPAAAAPIAAIWLARWSLPSDQALITWLDLSTGARGLVVASNERPDSRWGRSLENQLAAASEPPRISFGRPLGRFLCACAFGLTALLVPVAIPAPGPAGTLFEQLVGGLVKKLSTLEEVVELDPETLAELTDRLGRLAELAEEHVGREGLLESLDSFTARLESIASQAAEAGMEAAASLAAASTQALRNPEGARALFEQALAAIDAAGLRDELPEGLVELARGLTGGELSLPEGVELSPESLRKWSEALREGLLSDLDQLGRSGLVSISEAELAEMARELAELVESEYVCDADCKPGEP